MTATSSNDSSSSSNQQQQQPATQDRRELARRTKPIPCYALDQIPAKHGDADLYPSLATAVEKGTAQLIERLEIPPRDAKSWVVKAGQLFRITCHTGPQVADMNCWNLHNSDERFYASKTRQIHATHLTTGDRLWSNMPYLRPLATIVHDTIAYGFDDDGAGVHDVIGSRCDPYTHHLLSGGDEKHVCCHSNLTRACKAVGMNEMDVHDVLNVFMCTGFMRDTHQYFTKPSPVQVGDYLEFLAECDLRVAASTCPQGDVSTACAGKGEEPLVYPLLVEVYDLPTNFLASRGWKQSEVSGYSRNHGLDGDPQPL
jgi:uncharacterized protein YcgI (DUF1989 family)